MPDSITHFVVLFQARSGSTFLISTLSNHPEIEAQGEILVGMDTEKQLRRAARAFQVEDADQRGIRAVGFKCKFRDILDFDAFRDLLHSLDAKLIYLYRENTVKRVVSILNAIRLEEATGYWNLHKEENRPGPFAVDPNEFDLRLKKMEDSKETSRTQIEQLGRPTLTLTYEEILVDVDAVIRKILPFLGVSDRQLEGRTLKTTSDDLRSVVTNFDDLRSRYGGTVFEPMFDEVLAPQND